MRMIMILGKEMRVVVMVRGTIKKSRQMIRTTKILVERMTILGLENVFRTPIGDTGFCFLFCTR
ncbi:hypothetical protein D3D02_16510 [Halobellus sp. Atlit-38R]|nr:hypothetical protein D3D02_16510 [Halobellus sp. Atlit-38R]